MIPAPRGTGRVVAGFDGSWHARVAVERAGTEARQRGLPLQIVMLAQPAPESDLSPRAQAAQDRLDLEEAAGRLAEAVADARQLPGAPRVWGTLVETAERPRLADLLLGCSLLVVGDQGRLGRRAFVVGSASDELWRATDCPVLVVPGGARPGSVRGPVLVGVDARPHAHTVLAVAADEAARRGGRLEVLHAYPPVHGADPDAVVATARSTCDHQVAAAHLRPDVVVTRVVTCEEPAAALLSRAPRASLVVVGTRGPLGLAGLVAGSVSRGVLAGARCPVLLVPSPSEHRPSERGGRGEDLDLAPESAAEAAHAPTPR